jgi:hypothetical protein
MTGRMQLDKVTTRPGFFTPALVYSIVRADDGLYLICTGKGMGHRRQGGGVAGVAAGAILDRIEDRRAVAIDAAEAKLREIGPAAMVDTRYSRFVPRASIQQVLVEGSRVVIRAEKKHALHFDDHDPAQVRELFAPFIGGA